MLYIYLMLTIEIVILLLMYVKNKGDVFTPCFISMFMFFIATLCIIYNEELWSVSYAEETFYIVTIGFICIFFSDILASKLSRYRYVVGDFGKKNKEVLPQSVTISNKMSLCITLIMFLGLAEQTLELIRMGSSLGISVAINLIGAVKESDLNFSAIGKLFYQFNNIFLTIFIFTFAYNIGRNKNRLQDSIYYIMPIILGFINLIITGSRSILYRAVFAFIITLVISYKNSHYSQKSGKSSKELLKKIAVPMAGITFGFYALRAVTKGSTGSASRAFTEYLTYYIGSPLYIFNKYVLNPSGITNGSQYFGGLTFSGFYNSLYNFGVLDQPVENLKFVYVGDLSNNYYVGGNEYSLFMRPYDDFGIVGMIVFVFLLFFIFSFLYYRFSKIGNDRKSINALLVYSYFFYIIPMAFYYPFTVNESKIMNIVYMITMVIIFKSITKKKFESSKD